MPDTNTAALHPRSAPCRKRLTDPRSGSGRARRISLDLRILWRDAIRHGYEVKCVGSNQITTLLDELAGLDIH